MACITVEQLAIRKHHCMFIQICNCECVMDKLISSDLLRIVYLDRVKSDQDSKTLNRLVIMCRCTEIINYISVVNNTLSYRSAFQKV